MARSNSVKSSSGPNCQNVYAMPDPERHQNMTNELLMRDDTIQPMTDFFLRPYFALVTETL